MTSEELELRWQVEAMARDVVSTMSDGDRRKARRAIDASLRAWQNEQVANRQRGSPLRHHEDSALYMFAQLSEKTPAERAVSSVAAYAGIESTAEKFCALVLDEFAPAERVVTEWSLARCTAILVRREVKQMTLGSLTFVLQVLWLDAWEGRQFFKDEVRGVRMSKARHRRQIKDARLRSERSRGDDAEQERKQVWAYANKVAKRLQWMKREVLAEEVQKAMRAARKKDVPAINRIVRRLRDFTWPAEKARGRRTPKIA
jgi:signal transduction histidine kinase